MNFKKVSLLTFILSLLIVSVAAVSAQDDPQTNPNRPPRPPRQNPVHRAVSESLAEDTGLEFADIRDALSDHVTTWADLIIANGGDVQASIEKAVAAGTEVVNQGLADGKISEDHASEIIDKLSERVSNLVNNPLPQAERPNRPPRPRNDEGQAYDEGGFDDNAPANT